MILLELFWRFLLVSLLAFGGGQAALTLVERVAVADARWISEQDFAAAVGFGYLTPGPVLITAAFIGYRTAGPLGALAATVGIFLMPWFLAAAAAWQLRRFIGSPLLRGFGRGAAPAVVGLLAVTAANIGRHALASWPYAAIALFALLLALKTKTHPVLITAGGTLLGAVIGLLAAS